MCNVPIERSATLDGDSSKLNLYWIRVWSFTALCFVLPMRVSYVYSLSFILLVIWIAEGNLGNKIKAAFQSKLCRAFFAYYCVFIVGMLWTSNTAAGWQMVDRQTPFLLFLLYWGCAEQRFRERYVVAFIAGTTLCALLAHYNFLQLNHFPEWARGIRVLKSAGDTAPFVDRIMYAPILALAIYFAARYIVTSTNSVVRIAAVAVTGILLSNLLFSGGRAGVVMFAALLIALVFEKVKVRSKTIIICFALCIVAFYAAYKIGGHFAERINEGITDVKNFDENPNTSVGQRLVYWTTSLQLFANHPLLGVGSGDFQNEYALIKPKRWEATPDSFNPHNQFLMTAVTTGLLGLTLLLLIFYYAVKFQADKRTLSLLIGFAVVCLFESYLWRSNTSLTFAVMLAALTTKESQV